MMENRERKRTADHAWYMAHREHRKAVSRAWYRAHPEQRRVANVTYRQANRERFNEYRRQWRAANPGKMKAQTQRVKARDPSKWAKRIAQLKMWGLEGGRNVIFTARRRARLRHLPATLTLDQWKGIQAAYGYRCAYCGRKSSSLTQDHVVPIVKGGGYTPDNIVPACLSCNSRKSSGAPPIMPAKRLML